MKKIVIASFVMCLLLLGLFPATLMQTNAAEKRDLNLGESALGSEINLQVGDRIVDGLGSYAYGTDGTSSQVQPIVWNVLDTKTNMDQAEENDGLFLVSKNVLDWTLWNEYEIRNGKYYKEGAETFANEWEGSIAQAWCRNFYESTIRTSIGGDKTIPTSRTDESITLNNCWNGNTYSFGASKIENERVFFLSVREIKDYFADDAQRAASGAVIFYWTRSPHDKVGNDPRACYIHNDGLIGRHMGVDPYGARPALNLDYKELWFKKVADGEYRIVTEEEANNPTEGPEAGGDDTTGQEGADEAEKQYIDVEGVRVEVDTIQKNGPDRENIVWVIAGDGYTESEMTKYRARVDEVCEYFFQLEPYKQFKDKINIYALKTISKTSGLGTGEGGENDTFFGIHQSSGILADIGDHGLEFMRLSCEALKESIADSDAAITSYQIISNSNEYYDAGYLNGMLSIFTGNSASIDMAVHEMGHTHGLIDEHNSNSYGVNAANKLKGETPDVNSLSWRKFLGYKGVGAYEKLSYPQVTPKYSCMMNDYAEYCPVCKAHVFNNLNLRLEYNNRFMLYQDDIEITTAEEPGYRIEGGNIYDVHSNYEGTVIHTIGSGNITEANGNRLEARTIVKSYANEPQNYKLKLEIKAQDGSVKYAAQKTFTLLCNELESISVVTEELSGLVEGDTIETTLDNVGRSAPLKPPNKIIVENPNALTAEEKKAVEDAVREANQNIFPEGTEVKAGDNGEVRITYPDGAADTMQIAELVEERTVISYTVTFNSDGGSAVEPKTVIDNEAVTEPERPTREGYIFVGWYLEESDTVYDFTAPVRQNITLRAKWRATEDYNNEEGAVTPETPAVPVMQTVAAPTFSPNGGTFDKAQSVSITSATAGAKIYYTTDGSAPTERSTAYTKAINVDKSMTIKAIAVKDGMTNSDVAEAVFVIEMKAEKPWIFEDVNVNASNWKYQSVKYVYDNDIMGAISGTKEFQPDRPLSRSMFATVLYRMANSPKVVFENKFIDVPAGEWYSDAIIWAYKNKIVSGYTNGSFGIDDNITREQIAKMLYEYAKVCKHDISERNDLGSFTDQAKVSGWAVEYMQWATAMKMITGKPNDDQKTYRMEPKGDATRAECAAMLTRFAEKYDK